MLAYIITVYAFAFTRNFKMYHIAYMIYTKVVKPLTNTKHTDPIYLKNLSYRKAMTMAIIKTIILLSSNHII